MPKKRIREIKSTHQRQLEALRKAKIGTIDRARDDGVTPKQDNELVLESEHRITEHVEYTFNWKGESSSPLFVPRLVKEEEMESLRREFINSVARGVSDSDLDNRVLRNPQQFVDDTIEGIHRWHIHGKER